MKKYHLKKNGEIKNTWTMANVDSQGRRGLEYREPCFGPEGSFEVIEEEDHSERKEKLKKFRDVMKEKKAEANEACLDFDYGETTFTKAQLKKFRKAIQRADNPFSGWQDDPTAAAALDALDVNAYVWPVLGE